MAARKPLRLRFSQLVGELFRTQQAVDEAVSPLLESVLAQVSVLPAHVFTAGREVKLAHKLGTKPVGWLCIDARGTVFAGYTVRWDATTITVHPTTSGSATLMVF